jgi:hypothetical protein
MSIYVVHVIISTVLIPHLTPMNNFRTLIHISPLSLPLYNPLYIYYPPVSLTLSPFYPT